MELNLKDKVAVVTGGSKGIGLATASLLAAEGARVVVGSRSGVSLPDVVSVPVDLSSPAGPESLVAAAISAHGGVDLLVNNVAHSEPAPTIDAFSDEQWQRIFDLTFFAAVRATRAAVPSLVARAGSIVNIGSVNSRLPHSMVAPYSAAKAALANFSTALSEELAPQGVRVNTVSPGPVRTPLWTDPGGFASVVAPGVSVPEVMDSVLPSMMSISTGRVSEAAEIAGVVAFLASPHAANMTGADVVIDGGMLKVA